MKILSRPQKRYNPRGGRRGETTKLILVLSVKERKQRSQKAKTEAGESEQSGSKQKWEPAGKGDHGGTHHPWVTWQEWSASSWLICCFPSESILSIIHLPKPGGSGGISSSTWLLQSPLLPTVRQLVSTHALRSCSRVLACHESHTSQAQTWAHPRASLLPGDAAGANPFTDDTAAHGILGVQKGSLGLLG